MSKYDSNNIYNVSYESVTKTDIKDFIKVHKLEPNTFSGTINMSENERQRVTGC